jgi:hypothetical protein
MTKAFEKDNGHRMAHCAAGHHARRTILLKYMRARHGGKGPELLRFPLWFDEETLPVFSSRRAAQSFFFSRGQEGAHAKQM